MPSKFQNTCLSHLFCVISSTYKVGVFFPAVWRGEDDREKGLTAVLYPHRQIKSLNSSNLVHPSLPKSNHNQSSFLHHCDRLLCLQIVKLLKRSSKFLSSDCFFKSFQLSQDKRLSCINTTSQLSTSRISLPFTLQQRYPIHPHYISKIVSASRNLTSSPRPNYPLFYQPSCRQYFRWTRQTCRFCSCRIHWHSSRTSRTY